MSDSPEYTVPATPADFMVRMAELGAMAQTATVQAEMEALARMMASFAGGQASHPPPTEAEVESGFDNMPV